MTKDLFYCPICGGKRHIVIETGLAVCEACGKTFDTDPADVQKYGEILRDAERLMRQNTVAGYEDAIRLLASIPFVSGAKEKQTECEKRLSELQTMKRQRTESERIGDKRNIRIGVILLILTVLLMAVALAGIVYLIVRWVQGTLSRGTVITILAVAAAAVIISVLGRLFSGRGSDS